MKTRLDVLREGCKRDGIDPVWLRDDRGTVPACAARCPSLKGDDCTLSREELETCWPAVERMTALLASLPAPGSNPDR